MGVEYDIIVMRDVEGAVSFEKETIADDKIPEMINGEHGHHICFVRALAELIARQLAEMTDQYPLDEAAIRRISLASTLHDVGKTRIPEAILAKSGALSPVEYDIVKKHTEFGWELLESAGDSLDPELQACAQEIARYHHERYDGTGYPDGLKGEEIPIGAAFTSRVSTRRSRRYS